MNKQVQAAQLQEYRNTQLTKLRAERDEILTDRFSRQRAEEALMEKFVLCKDGPACQCSDCRVVAADMVDTVIEAWRGR